MHTFREKWIALSLASGCAVIFPGPAHPADTSAPNVLAAQNIHDHPAGQMPEQETQTIFEGWIAADNTLLDNMRGGFDIAPGLKVAFGIERLVNLNGVLQTATRIAVPDAGKLTQASAAPALPADAAAIPLAAVLGNSAAGLIQNGQGNAFAPGQLPQGAAATFIQNSVNNQTIQSMTIINATTNSLELLKGAHLQSTLFDALAQPVGVR